MYQIVSTHTVNKHHGQSVILSLQKADESCCSVWACGMLAKEQRVWIVDMSQLIFQELGRKVEFLSKH